MITCELDKSLDINQEINEVNMATPVDKQSGQSGAIVPYQEGSKNPSPKKVETLCW